MNVGTLVNAQLFICFLDSSPVKIVTFDLRSASGPHVFVPFILLWNAH